MAENNTRKREHNKNTNVTTSHLFKKIDRRLERSRRCDGAVPGKALFQRVASNQITASVKPAAVRGEQQ